MAEYYYTETEDQTLMEQLGNYVELQKEKVVLNLVEKSSNTLANLAVKVIFMVMALLAITMFCFGFAIFLNYRLENPFVGFLITGALLVLAGFVLYFMGKNWLADFIGNDLIDNIFKEGENHEE
ncbi:phage holin family protein [Jiulongibacter sediminis]|jgi:Zn-dependent protease with chaperone function|uniref:phage holin family protein n=1 Tax=Jiulongibacter sediminis TaxID=1605367 RepID=UPI0026F358C7|nr:phage holin family protein [Jiulongibacter sediminis]